MAQIQDGTPVKNSRGKLKIWDWLKSMFIGGVSAAGTAAVGAIVPGVNIKTIGGVAAAAFIGELVRRITTNDNAVAVRKLNKAGYDVVPKPAIETPVVDN